MEFISTDNALKPSGHYSQAVVHNDLIFISGQLSIDPITGKKIFGTVEEETERILQNIALILEKANSDKNHVLKTTIYISDIAFWDQLNKVYSQFFNNHKPARSVVPTNKLHFGFKVEIEAIAVVKKGGI